VQHGLTLYRSQCDLTSKEAVPWLERLVAEPRKSGFVSKNVRLGYVVEKILHCYKFFSILRFYPSSSIPHKLCTHLRVMSLVPLEKTVNA